MTELQEAARVLGMSLPGGTRASEVQYLVLIKQGFPIGTLDRISSELAPGDVSFKYRIVPRASLARFKANRRLSAPQSVVVTRLASVWAQALRIWKSPKAAREFLMREHPVLDGRRPLDLALENEIGAGLVHGVLGRLESGTAV